MKIKQWPPPQTVTHIRQFLGMASYYRRFVKDFSQIVRPMVQLTKKSVDFIWSDVCKKSFEEIKSILISAPVMSYPRDEGEYILDTDACDVSIGAVLSQVQEGQEKVISYGSRTLNRAETNYCVTDKELLALRYFVEYYRQYLLGRKFLVRTDHQALVWLFSFKEPKGRIARWLEILSAFEFSIQHRPGNKHGHADSMSRCPSPGECLCSEVDSLEYLKCGPCKKCIKRAVDMESTMQFNCKSDDHSGQENEEPNQLRAVMTRSKDDEDNHNLWTSWKGGHRKGQLSKMQENDRNIALVLTSLRQQSRPTGSDLLLSSPCSRHFANLWDSLVLIDNIVYKKFVKKDDSEECLQLLTPTCLTNEILTVAHNAILSGHFGRKKTLQRIRREFYWFEMRKDVEIWIQRCDVCAQSKVTNRKPKAPLGSIPVGGPLDCVTTDIVGPLPRTPRGNKYILTVMDCFTKWLEVYPIPDQTAETCAAKLLDEYIGRFGCPLALHSDQGSNFGSDVFQQLCQLMEIRKSRTSVRNPKRNGGTERSHRTLLQMIRAYLKGEQNDWDLHLGCLTSAYRSSENESTGLTPNMLMLGREVRTPLELLFGCRAEVFVSYGDYVAGLRTRLQVAHEICQRYLARTAKRRKDIYDARVRLKNYQPGDAVWYLHEQRKEGVCTKLQPLYMDPCVVLKKYNDLVYCVQLSKDGPIKVLNHDKLKPYQGQHYPKWGKRAISIYRRKK